MKRLLCLTLATAALVQSPLPAAAAEPEPQAWQTHGALRASGDGHRLVHADNTPFLWIGDTAWGLFQQLKREEVDAYLDNRKALGFTVVQAVIHWYPHGGGMPSGPTNATNAYGFPPFTGSDSAPDPARPALVPGGSPQSPNDYWDHADYVVEAVRKRGMYLALLPTWGRATVAGQFGEASTIFNEERARAYGEFLGARYRSQPNIIWVLGGDVKAQTDGFDKNQVPTSFDKRPVFRAMAEGIGAGVTGRKLAWDKPDGWDALFMTYHPDGDPLANSSTWFHSDAWLDANGVEVWREVDQVYPVMLNDYALKSPVKPSLFLEGSYEFGSYRSGCGSVTPVMVRRQAYHTFFAGGAGHTYGAGPIWAMRGTGGDYNCGYTWQQALAFPAATQFATIARKFLERYNWASWRPDGSLINGVGDKASLKTGVIAADDRLALVYFADASATRIRNRLKGKVEARWFDPRSGEESSAGAFAEGEERSMLPPDRWEDAVLILEAASTTK